VELGVNAGVPGRVQQLLLKGCDGRVANNSERLCWLRRGKQWRIWRASDKSRGYREAALERDSLKVNFQTAVVSERTVRFHMVKGNVGWQHSQCVFCCMDKRSA